MHFCSNQSITKGKNNTATVDALNRVAVQKLDFFARTLLYRSVGIAKRPIQVEDHGGEQ
jgi:hypothetical protein